MSKIELSPGQRYAWRAVEGWTVRIASDLTEPSPTRYPIIEPERLHEIKVGSTVLNVATGAEFEWTVLHARDVDRSLGLTPLLALIATPEEDA